MVLISSISLKSLYEDLWSPLMFKGPKFSKIFIKILKKFVKVFSLFMSVKKIISLQYLWDEIFYKDLQKDLLLLKTFQDHWRSLDILKYFKPCENAREYPEIYQEVIYCMFCLYSLGWKKYLLI